MLFLSTLSAGELLHPLHRLCVWAGATPAREVTIQQSVLDQAARRSLEEVCVPKPTVRSWNVLKITLRVMSAVRVQLAGRPPARVWGCLACSALMSWVEKSTRFLSHIWCFTTDVPSPVEHWGWCQPHHMKELSLVHELGPTVFPSKMMACCSAQKCMPEIMFWGPEVQQLTPHFSKFAASLTDGKHQNKKWFCNYTPRKPCISIQRTHNTQAEHKGHLCPHGGSTWTSFKKKGLTVLSTSDPTWYQHWCVSQHVTFHILLNLFWPFFLF